MAKELKYKPLVEAIFEIRWKLQGTPPNPQIDPHYKLLLGRLFDRLSDYYPEHEQLPIANFPEALAGHVVQHRFRVAAQTWPLVQLGPGILTLNSTDDYRWQGFRPKALSVVEKLYDAHPKVDDLRITNLILRYIDSVEFDYENENVFEFLKDELKLNTSLPDILFKDTGVERKPRAFTCHYSFRCERPKALISLRVATGQKDNTPAVLWETIIESVRDDLPKMPDNFDEWLDAAHRITDDWFFKMIEGDLRRRFSGE